MTKIQRLMNTLLLALGMASALGTEAHGTDSLHWAPDWGAELTTEQQVTTDGSYNCANLLRLQASLPVTGAFSVDVGSISTFMTSRESIGGDLQTFSNLDAGRIPFALSMCGVNWFASDQHSLFIGIRNMNEDYFCSPVTALFTNSSCGIFPTISANYDIANYPVASVGAHYRFEMKTKTETETETSGDDIFVFQASIYNGRGYNHFTGRENVFRFCPKSDGLFGLAEAAYSRGGSHYFVGTTVYWDGHTLQNINGTEPGSRGVSLTPWAYTEQRITDRLSLIAGYSHAFGHKTVCRDFAGLGGRYAWKRCELGLFTDYASFDAGDELATELTCKVALTRHLYLQPSVHAIFMPHDANLFHGAGTLRLGVTF